MSCPATAAPWTGSDVVELVRVRTDARAVCEPSLRGRYRYVARVPIHPGQASEIRVLAIGRRTVTGVWPALAFPRAVPFATLEPAPDLQLLVVYRSVRPTGFEVAEQAASRPVQDLKSSDTVCA